MFSPCLIENNQIYQPKYESKKGHNSTILVIGGSELYTGAPYFVSLSALKSGFDLCYIMSEKEAINPLKILLPEAIVSTIICSKWILDRINVCVIGPGLGRPNKCTIETIVEIHNYLKSKDIYFIFDGDGIFLYSQIQAFQNYSKTILTPNYNETKRLKNCEVTHCIEKGSVDIIHFGSERFEIADEGSAKRCGGQGDILCGILAYLVCKNYDIGKCMIAACKVLRRASNIAFKEHQRSLITRDIIQEISDAFSHLGNM